MNKIIAIILAILLLCGIVVLGLFLSNLCFAFETGNSIIADGVIYGQVLKSNIASAIKLIVKSIIFFTIGLMIFGFFVKTIINGIKKDDKVQRYNKGDK